MLAVAQQSMHLHRLSAHRDGLKRIRSCVCHKLPNSKGCFEPRKLRIYAWQVGPALLVGSVLLMVLGMSIMIWEGTKLGPLTTHDDNPGWWQSTSKVEFLLLYCSFFLFMFLCSLADASQMAVTWTIVLTISLSAYAAARLTLVESSTNATEALHSNHEMQSVSA